METWDRIVDGYYIDNTDINVVCGVKMDNSTVVAIDLSYAKNRNLSSCYVKNYIKKCGFDTTEEVMQEIEKMSNFCKKNE